MLATEIIKEQKQTIKRLTKIIVVLTIMLSLTLIGLVGTATGKIGRQIILDKPSGTVATVAVVKVKEHGQVGV